MTRLRMLTLALLLAAPLTGWAQAAQPPTPPPTPETPPADQVPPVPPEPLPAEPPSAVDVFGRATRNALRIGQDFRLPAGDAVRDAVVILGDVTIAGDVDGELIVVLGTVNLASTAIIRGDFVSVGGNVTVEPGVDARGDFVVVGGAFDGPPDFRPGREYVLVGGGLLGDWLQGLVPYLTRGLLWGRLIVPDLPWIWTTVVLFFLLYVALNALFDRPVRACATTLATRPLTSFGVGILVLLLVGPVFLLLAISVVGLAVIPFLVLAMIGGWIIGKVAVARWIGMSMVEEEPGSRAHAVRSVVLGFAFITVAYMIPVIGLATWAIVGMLGLGGATLAFLSAYRREHPRLVRPADVPSRDVPPPHHDVPPPPVPATYVPAETGHVPPAPAPPASASFVPPEPPPAMAYEATASPGGAAAAAAVPFSVPSSASPPSALAATLPKALFRDRLAAFVVDILLIAVVVNVLGADPDEMWMPILLAYFVGMWTWKQTTVGGVVCHLRVVRTDGTPLTLADALMRGLTGIVSMAVFAVGALWMLRDPDSQTWHDKVAGTYVVKVPRSWPF